MIVTIDGPAGAGKSTVARGVAQACGMTYLDTGAMYRAVAVACLDAGVDPGDAEAAAAVARAHAIKLLAGADGTRVTLDGTDVTDAIRTRQVDECVAIVAASPGVRQEMCAAQRAIAAGTDIVAEGRDMASVVFPNADVKVFLTASVEARARRRAAERGVVGTTAEGEVRALIEERDALDSVNYEAARDAEGVHLIDSSGMDVPSTVAAVVALVEDERRASDTAGERSGDVAQPVFPSAVDTRAPSTARGVTSGRMRAFAGNALDDYYEHAMCDFPLPARALLCLAINVVWIVSKIVYPWRLEEAERLWATHRAGDTGRVVVMNHISMVDPVLLVVALYHHGIRTRPISKSEFSGSRFVEWALCRFGCIPVVRGTADIKAVRRAQRALQRGEYVLIFPEGTRIRNDEQPVTIHGGFALMAHMGRARVQPVAIVGARRGARQVLPHPHRVFLKAGEPIAFEEVGGGRRKEQIARMEDVAVARMYELRDELRDEHPGRR